MLFPQTYAVKKMATAKVKGYIITILFFRFQEDSTYLPCRFGMAPQWEEKMIPWYSKNEKYLS